MSRLEQTSRRAGAGRRSRVFLSSIAYCSGLVESAEAFLGPAGYFTMLHGACGVPAGATAKREGSMCM